LKEKRFPPSSVGTWSPEVISGEVKPTSIRVRVKEHPDLNTEELLSGLVPFGHFIFLNITKCIHVRNMVRPPGLLPRRESIIPGILQGSCSRQLPYLKGMKRDKQELKMEEFQYVTARLLVAGLS
jgi:hypothetical protein